MSLDNSLLKCVESNSFFRSSESRIVVSAVNGDGEGIGGGQAIGVSDLIGDVDELSFTNGERVVSVVGGIKGP